QLRIQEIIIKRIDTSSQAILVNPNRIGLSIAGQASFWGLKFGKLGPCQNVCPFCDQEDETIDHLLVDRLITDITSSIFASMRHCFLD
ncbi:hypothetical protein ACJX0J_039296, partial [Zea mays]